MKSGIIVDAGIRYWIVLTSDGQFRKIRKTHHAVIGEEVVLPAKPRSAARMTVTLIAAAAVILLLLALPNMLRSYPEVAVYLAIDFNPSLELGVDRDDRVLELRSWNADGATMIRDLKFENIGMQEVLGEIVERAKDGHYLTSEAADVIVTSVMTGSRPDALLEARLADQVSLVLESALDLTVTVLSAPAELRDEAAEHGMTPGKMAIYLLSKYANEPIRMNELRQLSIHQAMARHGGLESIIGQLDAAGSREALERMLGQELAHEGEEPASSNDGPSEQSRGGGGGELPEGASIPGEGRGWMPDHTPHRADSEQPPVHPVEPESVERPETGGGKPPSPQKQPPPSPQKKQPQEDERAEQGNRKQGGSKENPGKNNREPGHKTQEKQKKPGNHEKKPGKPRNPSNTEGQEREGRDQPERSNHKGPPKAA
ncbi:anti-sigma factor domain-containing protein [Paenibacillus sp. 1P07SE]|uniref:anti-sigma factor domain-containing protein n=1 Tax=Paenibacillus sp. 1P07SE TaxID=3132209 RepID=UPI0039A5E17C